MKIEATEYRRSDGVSMFRHQGGWIVRDVLGAAWFWDNAKTTWIWSPSVPGKEWGRFVLPEEQAMEVLRTVSRVSDIKLNKDVA